MKVAHRKLLKEVDKLFNEEKYQDALIKCSQILAEDPYNREARILTMIIDMAMNEETGAEALYDYYTILKNGDIPNAEEIIQNIIDVIDSKSLEIQQLFNEPLQQQLLYLDGISYSDFKDIAVKQKGFKRAFEDIIFTTKVIITSRDDFIDFLNNLIKHGFYGVALNYLEGALNNYPDDKTLQFLAKKLNIRNET
ncbi:MAG TPA: hypothetical protein EYO61_05965 [Campylobacterales bacterium]|nr:hypothetical protein [Campylobacterales bacterium]HIO70923.1 hypothetical protein [Campylobacterales bacterium]